MTMPADAAREHPFVTAWRDRDSARWASHLNIDVTLDSPILGRQFCGRDQAKGLFEALFEVFGRFTITEHYVAGHTHVFFWEGDIGQHTIRGVDRIVHAADGSIERVTAHIRPLVALGIFSGALGSALARRRGRARGLLVAVASRAVQLTFQAIDRLAPKLIGMDRNA